MVKIYLLRIEIIAELSLG